MSWMDSWSRPGKSQATPVPYYLLPGGESTPYCRSCGRVISSRRANAATAQQQQHDINGSNQKPSYCSQRCRNTKPRKLDRDIEAVFVRMLTEGEADSSSTRARQEGKKPGKSAKERKGVITKGDPRVIVSCDAVEKAVFGDLADPEKSFGRKKNRASRVISAAEAEAETKGDQHNPHHREDGYAPREVAQDVIGNEDVDSAVALNDSDLASLSPSSSIDGDVLARMAVRSGTRTRPPQHASLVNGSVGGEKGRAERGEETEEMARRRLDGQQRAQQREMVRSAARRGVVFGFALCTVKGQGQEQGQSAAAAATTTTTRRKCEAVVQGGRVVEPSFAKGDWGVRWRE